MSLYDNANVFEKLNAGVYAPLTGFSSPMVEPVTDLATSLEAGQGVNITAAGVVSLSTDNATHVIAGSHIGLVDGTFKIVDTATAIPAVVLGQALIDCQVKAAEVLVKGDEVSFEAGQLVKWVAQTQKFVVEAVETVDSVITARIKFK